MHPPHDPQQPVSRPRHPAGAADLLARLSHRAATAVAVVHPELWVLWAGGDPLRAAAIWAVAADVLVSTISPHRDRHHSQSAGTGVVQISGLRCDGGYGSVAWSRAAAAANGCAVGNLV